MTEIIFNKRIIKFIAALVIGLSAHAKTSSQREVSSCIPENNLYIPPFVEGQGVSESGFHRVIDLVERVYSPIIRQMGGELKMVRLWDEGIVNAAAIQRGHRWFVYIFGGMARHPSMTEDGLALVLCHEIGHHIGGAPKIPDLTWISNEGQSDYFATLKCLRRVFGTQNSVRIVSKMQVDPKVQNECSKSFRSANARAICMRSSMAGKALALVFQNVSREKNEPSFGTPDLSVVKVTNNGHPGTQCRLDTYFAGAICTADLRVDVSQTDLHQGVCSRKFGESRGARPLCWFAEESPLL